jgi:rare lipoprotein A
MPNQKHNRRALLEGKVAIARTPVGGLRAPQKRPCYAFLACMGRVQIIRLPDVHDSVTSRNNLIRYFSPLLAVGCAGLLSACGTAPVVQPAVAAAPPAPAPEIEAAEPSVTGLASWYRTGRRLHRTYSGELLDNDALTAASSVLPMGTVVRVGLLDDDSRSVVVRVNDRMPHNRRLIDLSEIAAKDLGLMGCGVATVTVTPIEVASEP